jgi:hypoxanthine phosphoribosyltransferase
MPEQQTVIDPTAAAKLAEVVFDEETIHRRVAELGQQIGEYYQSGNLLLVGLLKGSFIFLADLVRCIARPHELDFLVAASYGGKKKSSGYVELRYDPETELGGKHVLLVEDIIDSGATLNRLVEVLRMRGPASLEICALLHKRMASGAAADPRFLGFDAPKKFLVGYGLDYAEQFRHLPYIASLKE